MGAALAAVLGRRFVETDAVIVERYGPIPAIFAEHGEAAFRTYERELADELADETSLVVSTGGGMLIDPAIAERFESSGRVFCLTASPATTIARVRADGIVDRPLLDTADPEARVAELLAERSEAYASSRRSRPTVEPSPRSSTTSSFASRLTRRVRLPIPGVYGSTQRFSVAPTPSMEQRKTAPSVSHSGGVRAAPHRPGYQWRSRRPA